MSEHHFMLSLDALSYLVAVHLRITLSLSFFVMLCNTHKSKFVERFTGL